MKKVITSVALLTSLCVPAYAAIEHWTWSGTLNLVSTPLQSEFSVGQSFTVNMAVDTAAAALQENRSNFYTSSAVYNAIVNGSVTVNDWYTAEFESGSDPSYNTFQVRNAEETAPESYYDQLTMSFFDYSELIDAPVVDTGTATFTVNSIEFNVYGPIDMIVGTGATSPTVDAPMLLPGINFFPEESTNGPYHFVIRFQEGDGLNMLRGTFTDFAVVPEPGHAALALGVTVLGLLYFRRHRSSAPRASSLV